MRRLGSRVGIANAVALVVLLTLSGARPDHRPSNVVSPVIADRALEGFGVPADRRVVLRDGAASGGFNRHRPRLARRQRRRRRDRGLLLRRPRPTAQLDGGDPLGPFPASTSAARRPATIDRVTGQVLRFIVATSTGGNVGAVELGVYRG